TVWTTVQAVLAPLQFLVFLVSLALVLTALFADTAHAAAADARAWTSWPAGEVEEVARILDGHTMELASGLLVRLAEVEAPKVWPGDDDDPELRRLERDARRALESFARGRSVELRYVGPRRDRHLRALAHVLVQAQDGGAPVWLQEALVEAGAVYVRTSLDARAGAPLLLALEDEARSAGRGLWAARRYRPRKASEVEMPTRDFAIVEGEVAEAADVRGRVYLNFGADYRSDFTISLAPKTAKLFRAEGVAPLAYEGRRVRVRGWVDSFNGPLIEATHPEQIEVVP
ncbi:MAG: 2-vinyl bacteriochlorophyllide hydratase, partial [Pseudomonadota bacterium]